MTARSPVVRRRLALMAALILTLAAGWPRTTTAQVLPMREYEVKAGYLYNFMKFVVWPDDAFSSEWAPIQVDILGRDPSGGALEFVLAGKTIGNRTIVVTYPLTPLASAPGHMVFVSNREAGQLTAVLLAYAHSPVLTVSDINGFAERGGVIGFLMEGRNLRFAINRDAGEQNRLKISSQLLSLAANIGPRPQALFAPAVGRTASR